MTPVDLDAIEGDIRRLAREVDNVYTDARYRAPTAKLEVLAHALVAELRAAREVIAHYEPPHCSQNCTCTRSTAWRAYQAVTS